MLEINDALLEDFLKCKAPLKDGLHATFAMVFDIPMISGDKKHIENMRKLYTGVFKPGELLRS